MTTHITPQTKLIGYPASQLATSRAANCDKLLILPTKHILNKYFFLHSNFRTHFKWKAFNFVTRATNQAIIIGGQGQFMEKLKDIKGTELTGRVCGLTNSVGELRCKESER